VCFVFGDFQKRSNSFLFLYSHEDLDEFESLERYEKEFVWKETVRYLWFCCVREEDVGKLLAQVQFVREKQRAGKQLLCNYRKQIKVRYLCEVAGIDEFVFNCRESRGTLRHFMVDCEREPASKVRRKRAPLWMCLENSRLKRFVCSFVVFL